MQLLSRELIDQLPQKSRGHNPVVFARLRSVVASAGGCLPEYWAYYVFGGQLVINPNRVSDYLLHGVVFAGRRREVWYGDYTVSYLQSDRRGHWGPGPHCELVRDHVFEPRRLSSIFAMEKSRRILW
jgi:hypothetical protein